MMFICYSLTLGILGFAYHAPDLFLWVALVLAARILLRRSR